MLFVKNIQKQVDTAHTMIDNCDRNLLFNKNKDSKMKAATFSQIEVNNNKKLNIADLAYEIASVLSMFAVTATVIALLSFKFLA